MVKGSEVAKTTGGVSISSVGVSRSSVAGWLRQPSRVMQRMAQLPQPPRAASQMQLTRRVVDGTELNGEAVTAGVGAGRPDVEGRDTGLDWRQGQRRVVVSNQGQLTPGLELESTVDDLTVVSVLEERGVRVEEPDREGGGASAGPGEGVVSVANPCKCQPVRCGSCGALSRGRAGKALRVVFTSASGHGRARRAAALRKHKAFPPLSARDCPLTVVGRRRRVDLEVRVEGTASRAGDGTASGGRGGGDVGASSGGGGGVGTVTSGVGASGGGVSGSVRGRGRGGSVLRENGEGCEEEGEERKLHCECW